MLAAGDLKIYEPHSHSPNVCKVVCRRFDVIQRPIDALTMVQLQSSARPICNG